MSIGKTVGMCEYRRHLPHQIPPDRPIFLTWNLKGAIPRRVANRLQKYREELQSQPPRPNETPRNRAVREGKMTFARVDRYLDAAKSGPLHLSLPKCAATVDRAIRWHARDRYSLLAWCVMPNHAHVLLTPHLELWKITKGIKGFTARKINRELHRTGNPLWQDESYDHWIRDEEELLRVVHYIEMNPVKAGLCAQAADWEFSSARLRQNWNAGEPIPAEFIPTPKSIAGLTEEP